MGKYFIQFLPHVAFFSLLIMLVIPTGGAAAYIAYFGFVAPIIRFPSIILFALLSGIVFRKYWKFLLLATVVGGCFSILVSIADKHVAPDKLFLAVTYTFVSFLLMAHFFNVVRVVIEPLINKIYTFFLEEDAEMPHKSIQFIEKFNIVLLLQVIALVIFILGVAGSIVNGVYYLEQGNMSFHFIFSNFSMRFTSVLLGSCTLLALAKIILIIKEKEKQND